MTVPLRFSFESPWSLSVPFPTPASVRRNSPGYLCACTRCACPETATFSTSRSDRIERLFWRRLFLPAGRSLLLNTPEMQVFPAAASLINTACTLVGAGVASKAGGAGRKQDYVGGGGADRGRLHVRLLQLLLGRAPWLSLTQGHHAAAALWGRGCLCRSPWVRRSVCVCACVCVLHQSGIFWKSETQQE